MALATVNGFSVLEARITLPLQGAWRIDAVLSTDQELTGIAGLTIGAYTWAGDISEFTSYAGTGVLVLTPGAGASQTTLAPAAWRNATIRTILDQTLRSAGESISTATPALSTVWPYYVRMRGTFGAALNKIASLAGCVWRYDDAGAVLMTPRAFTATSQPFRVVGRDPRIDQFTITSDELFARPGLVIDGRNVVAVEHSISPDGVRSAITYEGA